MIDYISGIRKDARKLPFNVFLAIVLFSAAFGFQPINIAAAREDLAPNAGEIVSSPVVAPLNLPVPSVTLNVPADVQIGQAFSFTATFDNTDADEVGYGPYIDLVLPAAGVDGFGVEIDDGITFVSAAYLGVGIPADQIYQSAFPDADGAGPGTTGCVSHPLAVQPGGQAPLHPELPNSYLICGTAGDQLVTIVLPFGSFVPAQPPATVTVNAQLSNLADLSMPLGIRAQGGFQFGATPTNDFCCFPFDATLPIPPGGFYDTTAWPPENVTPSLMTMDKNYIGPENETSTGPNFPRQFEITVDIAEGQTVTNLVIQDNLPGNIQFVSLDPVTPADNPLLRVLPSTSAPGGTLSVTIPSVTGGPGANDARLVFTYFVDRAVSGVPILPPVTGSPTVSSNSANASGTWLPIDPRDQTSPPPATASCGVPCITVQDQSIVVQKGVTNTTDSSNSPGDVLEYTLNFQGSDFFGLQDINLTDVISDGQHFDPSFTPELTLNGNPDAKSLAAVGMAADNVDVTCNYTGGVLGLGCDFLNPTDGTTTIVFNFSDELADQFLGNGQLLGGCVNPAQVNNPPVCSGAGSYNDGPTTGTIRFRTIIQQDFTDNYPSGDTSVDHGDVLADDVTISGEVLDISTAPVVGHFPGTGNIPTDNSSASLNITFGALQKSLYAVNGSTTIPAYLSPGDLVTYRLRYTQPASDFEETIITDFLPLPVFSATELTTLTNSICGFPAAGEICLGPDDNYHNLNSRGEDLPPADPPGNPVVAPTFITDGAANSLKITYAEYDSVYNVSSVMDILFSVTVENDPFADGLFLTNQANATEGTTNAGDQELDAIVQIQIGEPTLRNAKTAVSTNHLPVIETSFMPNRAIYSQFSQPGSAGAPFSGTINTDSLNTDPSDPDLAFNLFNGNLTGVDGGDLVKYAIVVENKGHSQNGAYDIVINDVLPPGMFIPANAPGLNLQVYRGDGTPLSFEVVDFGGDGKVGGGDDSVLPGIPANAVLIFDANHGIRVVDPTSGPDAGKGVCQVHDATSGKNVIVFTYDLMVDNTNTPGETITNTSKLHGYGSREGGPNFIDEPLKDDADILIGQPAVAKVLTGTEFNYAGNNDTQVVIGELVTYTITATFHEGVLPPAKIVDDLDSGLAFVDLVSVTASNPDTDGTLTVDDGIYSDKMTFDAAGLCTNCTAGTTAGTSNPFVENTGSRVTFDLGTVTDTNVDNNTDETLTIVYRAVTLNVVGNQAGTVLNNSALLSWDDSKPLTTDRLPTVFAPEVTVVEPNVNITKSASPASGMDAGDAVSFTVTLENPNPVDAFDLTLNDPLPVCAVGGPSTIDNPSISSVVDSAGLVTASSFELTGSNAAGWTLRTVAAPVTTFDMPSNAGRTITITVSGTVAYCVAPNQTVTNMATVRWTSLDADVIDRSTYNNDSDERTGVDGVGGVLNDYAQEGAGNFITTPIVPTKHILSTSENFSTAASGNIALAIGEIVRYRLVINIPEGTSTNFQLLDNPQAGLSIINDNSAKAVFVSNSGVTGVAVGSIPPVGDPDCQLAGNLADGTNPAIPAACDVLADNNVGTSNTSALNDGDTPSPTDVFGSGTDIYFKLGTLTNNDSDADAEYIVLEFNAILNNVNAASNDANDPRTNSFQAYINLTANGPVSNNMTVRVVEPSLSVAKTAPVLPSPSDAGGLVSYTITITAASNATTSTAFDINVTDAVDASLNNISIASLTSTQPATCVGSGSGTTAFSSNSSVVGQNVTVTATCLDPGQSITATVNATVADTAPAGDTVPNTANLTYTSLPGTGTPNGTGNNNTGSTTPGASGSNTGERNGAGGATPQNDHNGTSTVSFTLVQPLLDKRPPVPSQYTIGDQVTFNLLVILPEGLTRSLTVTDDLPVGLEYVSHQVITTMAGSSLLTGNYNGTFTNSPPSFTPPTGSGSDLALNFGDTTTPGDNNPSTNSFVVQVVARVVNEYPANTDGLTLTNIGRLTYLDGTSGSRTISDSENVTIVEPRIATDKNLTAPLGNVQAGDVVFYTVRFSNTGNSTAYDVTASDILAQGVAYNAGSATCQYFNGVALVGIAVSVSDGGTTLTFDGNPAGSWDIPATTPDSYIECAYSVTAQNSLLLNGSHTNSVDADWSSLDGVVPNERTYNDTVAYPFDGTQDTDTVSFPTVGATIAKDDGGVTQTVIGQTIHFTLTITTPLGTLRNAEVIDHLPAGLIYVAGTQSVGAGINPDADAAGFTVTGPSDGSGPVTLTWDFGSNPYASGTTFTIQYDAIVANVPGNQNLTVLLNNVDLNYQDAGGTNRNSTDSESSTVTEPVLNVSKSADDSFWVYGQIVSYTLTLGHNVASTATAHDIVVTDVIPTGLTYSPGSIAAPAGCAADASAAPTLTWTCSSLLLGNTLSLSYQATVNTPPGPPAALGGDDTAINTVNVVWTSMAGNNNPGSTDGERDGSGSINDYATSTTHTGGLENYYSLGNRVWFDTNNNSLIDAGEVGVNSVVVNLYSASDLTTIIATDTTSGGGYYLFDFLFPGNYVVAVAASNFVDGALLDTYWSSGTTVDVSGVISESAGPGANSDNDSDDDGMLQTSGTLNGAVIAEAVILGPTGSTEPLNESDLEAVIGDGAQPDGRANMTVDFGFYRTGIGNLVWLENIAADGQYSGEAPVDNSSVRLYAGNGTTEIPVGSDGALGTGVDAPGGVATNASGIYGFSGLPQGDYIVRVVGPADTVSTTDAFNGADSTNPTATNADNNDNGLGTVDNSVSSATLTMTPGSAGALGNNTVSNATGTTTNPTLDFGFAYAYALGNRVWFDTDNNSQIDFADELGVDGVRVDLYSPSDLTTILATDTTANGGYYLFDNLFPGDYVVVIPASNFSGPGVLTGYWSSATTRAGDGTISEIPAPDADLGPDGVLGGGDDDLDSDDNGTRQTSGGFTDAVISSAVTLGPIGLTEPASESDLETGVNQGTQPDGRANMTVDFGFYRVAVGNLVFGDLNKDGTYDTGDTLLSNIAVQLYSGDNSTLIASTTTNGSGLYSFTGQPDGNYILRTTAPVGTASTIDSFDQADNDGPNTNTDNNDNGDGTANGVVSSAAVSLTPGSSGLQSNNTVSHATGTTTNPTMDFGFSLAYALGNRVWFDTNNDSQISAGEVGIDGVTVRLYSASDLSTILLTDITSGGGYYMFNNLDAGDYVVVLPASNFASTAVLEGYWSSGTRRNNDGSLIEAAAPDADGNASDADDNGTLQNSGPFSGGVAALTVTIGPGGIEPVGETDLEGGAGQGQPDAQANMTVDFGFYTMQLGDLVWNDANNTGLVDLGDAGLANVDVQLWSSDFSTLLLTDTTDGTGAYGFSGLPQGNYVLRIPAAEFNPGGTLRDYVSSTGGVGTPYEPAPSAESNTTDSDDNGSITSGTLGLGGYVQSNIFALTPAAEGSMDNARGLTLEPRIDFGLYFSRLTDLAVTKTDSTTFYVPGSTLTYTITVTNNGPSDADGATISDALPVQISSWTWVCTGSSGGASGCDGAPGLSGDFSDTVNLPQLSSITYTVTAAVAGSATGALDNTVTVTVPGGVTDSNIANNTATDSDAPASLQVSKDDGLLIVGADSTLTYQVVVTNNGAVDLTSITITDNLPTDLTYQSAIPAPTNATGQVLTWSGLSLTAGSSITISITAAVADSPSGGAITNSVDVVDTNTNASARDDDVDSVVASTDFTKTLVDTNHVPTTDPTVAIGEILTYDLVLAVPAGSMVNAQVVDTPQTGLAFVDQISVTASNPDTDDAGAADAGLYSSVMTFDAVTGECTNCTDGTTGGVNNPLIENSGSRVTFDLGTLTNSTSEPETLTIRYSLIVLDIAENQNSGTLANNATWTWTGGNLHATAPIVNVVEPDLLIDKNADPPQAPYGASITFTLDIAHTTASAAHAYDVVITDVLPSGLVFIPGSLSFTGHPPTTSSYDPVTFTLTFVWDEFQLGQTATITFQATFVGPAPVINNSNVFWSSLPIDPVLGIPVLQSPYNNSSTERWYDPLDSAGLNNYGMQDSVTITVPRLPDTGFAPGMVTNLPSQPDWFSYTDLGDFWIEIPELDVKLPIVGVPLNEKGWNLTWLADQAGWLEGTAYPTHPGNSAITAHVYDAEGQPGPFINLNRLYWGHKIIVHLGAQKYVYEVREVRLLWPDDNKVFRHEEYSWLTLITCKDYNKSTDSYAQRIAVRAVLISVEDE